MVVSSTRIVVSIYHGGAAVDAHLRDPLPTPEPPLPKIFAIDTGTGLVYLNPDGGGLAIQNNIPSCIPTVRENEGLKVYQSTKQIQITGSCFNDNMQASAASQRFHSKSRSSA